MTVAERITITLPNELYKRLQSVKEKLNVSGLCQTTIERAITIEEIKLKDIAVMDKVVERLLLEKQEADQEWKETGLVDGLEDAQELSYDDFRAIEKGEISEENREWILEKNFDDDAKPDSDEFDIYLQGWSEGVLHFWAEVKNRLNVSRT
jgi:predicted CopG family antitoxin